jgi:hypothetical protein
MKEACMVRMTVGGRPLELTKEAVLDMMRNVQPEPVREHLVEMLGTAFPPKQVLATVTGWNRQSFTTMEAQRVLTRLGFVCRRAGRRSSRQPGWGLDNPKHEGSILDGRLSAAESALAVAQEAIARLASRVTDLEASK